MSETSETEKITPESTKAIETSVLEGIKGVTVEQRLMDLAQIGGSIEKISERVPVSRLAFSEEDRQARVFLNKQMVEAGMSVTEYPFGLVGTYAGESNPRQESPKPSVMLMSHFDSVPNGGAY